MSKPPLMLALLLAQGTAAPLDLKPLWGTPNVVASHIPPLPEGLAQRVHQYAQVRSATLRDVAPDGRAILVATQFGSTTQLHRVSTPLGAREQLTFYAEPVGQAAFLPDDTSTLLLLHSPLGSELSQLERLDLRTGKGELLTDGKSRHQALVLSRDGKWVAYSGTGRNGQDSDVYLAEVADARRARRLTELEGTWLPLEFSPGAGQLLLREEKGAAAADIWLLDVKTLARRRLVHWPDAAQGATVRQASFSADGEAVYLLTDAFTPLCTLVRVDVSTPDSPPQPVVAEPPGEVEQLAVASDGTLVLSTNEAGYSRAYQLKGARLEALPLPAGVLHTLRFPNKRSDVLFFTLEGPTSPSDVWALSLRTKQLIRWTRSEVGGLEEKRFITPALVHYRAEDGTELQALYYRPGEVAAGTKLPVVVSFHDGPAAQERPVFRPEVQLLLEEGFSVLAPNIRGSDGQGKAFLAADDGVKREQALKDISATLGWLNSQSGLDTRRVAAWGRGYGGYLALAAAAFYPAGFRAAVDVSGVGDLAAFVESAPAYRRTQLRAEYGDERRPEVREVLDRISPLHAVGRMQAALLVVQGKKDARVPAAQAEQLVRARGPDGWYLLALEEGHAFRQKETEELVNLALVLFLQKTLGGSP